MATTSTGRASWLLVGALVVVGVFVVGWFALAGHVLSGGPSTPPPSAGAGDVTDYRHVSTGQTLASPGPSGTFYVKDGSNPDSVHCWLQGADGTRQPMPRSAIGRNRTATVQLDGATWWAVGAWRTTSGGSAPTSVGCDAGGGAVDLALVTGNG